MFKKAVEGIAGGSTLERHSRWRGFASGRSPGPRYSRRLMVLFNVPGTHCRDACRREVGAWHGGVEEILRVQGDRQMHWVLEKRLPKKEKNEALRTGYNLCR